MRFWDSSAVVPLIVKQAASAMADRWLREDGDIAVWTLTSTEVLSALRRLERENVLGQTEADLAEERVEELWRALHVVIDVEGVKARARRLLRSHALRAADGLQLGAALAWSAENPAGRVLHTFDTRLATAARREGFRVP